MKLSENHYQRKNEFPIFVYKRIKGGIEREELLP